MKYVRSMKYEVRMKYVEYVTSPAGLLKSSNNIVRTRTMLFEVCRAGTVSSSVQSCLLKRLEFSRLSFAHISGVYPGLRIATRSPNEMTAQICHLGHPLIWATMPKKNLSALARPVHKQDKQFSACSINHLSWLVSQFHAPTSCAMQKQGLKSMCARGIRHNLNSHPGCPLRATKKVVQLNYWQDPRKWN